MASSNRELPASRLNLARARELLRIADRKRADLDIAGAQELERTAEGLLLSSAPPIARGGSCGPPLVVAVYDAAMANPERVWTDAREGEAEPMGGWIAVSRPNKGYLAVLPQWVNETLLSMGATPRATIATWKACGWIVPDHVGTSSRSTVTWSGRARMIRIRIAAVESLRAAAGRTQSS